jgi:predicted membrane protein
LFFQKIALYILEYLLQVYCSKGRGSVNNEETGIIVFINKEDNIWPLIINLKKILIISVTISSQSTKFMIKIERERSILVRNEPVKGL